MSTAKPRPRKVILTALVAASAILISRLAYHETRTPHNQTEVLNRMIELQKEGRYDKAVKVVQDWMNKNARDDYRDGMLYGQIAVVYITKADKRPATKNESVQLAKENLEKELNLFDKQGQGELSVDLFEIGGSYETLGDIADGDKCPFYQKARELYEKQLPLIKGDSYTTSGKTFSLEPVRRDVRKHLDATNEKLAKAVCQPQ
jgi:tetratricopeptide (TPR) repeat protein